MCFSVNTGGLVLVGCFGVSLSFFYLFFSRMIDAGFFKRVIGDLLCMGFPLSSYFPSFVFLSTSRLSLFIIQKPHSLFLLLFLVFSIPFLNFILFSVSTFLIFTLPCPRFHPHPHPLLSLTLVSSLPHSQSSPTSLYISHSNPLSLSFLHLNSFLPYVSPLPPLP